MKRLLLVSNRLPVTVEKRKNSINFKESVGGLATGIRSFYQSYEGVWIGWCGLPSGSLDSRTRKQLEKDLLEKYKNYPTFLSKKDIRLFYSGFCNKTIWPLFHYFPDYADYDREAWESYKRVNRLFSQAVVKMVKPGDTVWVHDYHLFLLPRLLRDHLPNVSIGFFLHIPFPSYELFRLLPWREEILNGILGSDLIGFHTYDYVRHFNSSIRRLLGYEHTFGQITVENRIVKVDAFPMGIDYERYAQAESKNVWINKIQSHCEFEGGCKVILSIDRLDYTKGIPERLEAFDYFLEKYPQYKNRVTLIMVAVPSRTSVETYRHLKKQVDELVGRINGKHGTMGWMPVWYYYRFFPFSDIVSLYGVSDVALVTPIRDGMNLIAKEYIARRQDEKGVLILSEMAGARAELAEAIIVNPNNKEQIADALHSALTMSDEEQIARNRTMKNRLKRYNVETWAHDFMDVLAKINTRQKEIKTRSLSSANQKRLLKKYLSSGHRLLLLDYDGTLVHFRSKPEQAKPDEALLMLLQNLIRDPKNEVVIVSGRDKASLDEWLGHLNIGLSAEHGVWMKADRRNWEITEPMSDEWKQEIRTVLETYVNRTPGSFIEEKSYSLVWHYRRTNPELGLQRSRELKENLLHLTSNLNLTVLEGSRVLEIKSGGVHKGRTALQWLTNHKWDFILAVGDDWTDEDLFEALPESAFTIKVGLEITKARYYLNNQSEVRSLLKRLGDSTEA